MNCPNCGAALRLDRAKECLVCGFCGSVQFPTTDADGVCDLGDKSTLPCPVCAIPLVDAAVSGHALLYCERCRGLLVEMATFVHLIDRLRAAGRQPPEPPHPLDPKELARVLRCQKCARKMDAHPYAGPGGVTIDSCSECLLDWLDHSELKRIVTAPERLKADDWSPSPPLPTRHPGELEGSELLRFLTDLL